MHRKENVGSTEKAITIYGQPENCTKACAEILKVMREEAKTAAKASEDEAEGEGGGEREAGDVVSLKVPAFFLFVRIDSRILHSRDVCYHQILAHNNLIGRIIGKGGATIKKIMEETGTKITVSSISDINAFNVERTITIAASEVENVSRAEAEISSKLRKAYEHDVQEVVVRTSLTVDLVRVSHFAHTSNPTVPQANTCFLIVASGDSKGISCPWTMMELIFPPLHFVQPQSMMFPGLHPAAMMSMPGMGMAGISGGQQGAAPQSAAAGPGFSHQAQQAGGPPPAGSGGSGHSNGWGRPAGPNAPNTGMFNGSAGQRQSPSTHHAAAAAASMNPFAAAAAASGFSQVSSFMEFNTVVVWRRHRMASLLALALIEGSLS